MRTFVASSNSELGHTIWEALLRAGHDGQVSGLTPKDAVVGRVAQQRPDLVAVAVSVETETALELLRDLRPAMAGRLLAVGPAGDPRLRLESLRAGADHYLDDALLEQELDVLLSRPQATRAAAPPPPDAKGEVISLLAPSGGCGASTLAVNLAALLAREHKSCALFDLRLGGGDLAALMDLKPTHTLADLCKSSARMDRTMFEGSLVRHDSGVHLLSPPRSFADIALVSTQGVRQALTLAREMFPYVVVDLDDSFHPEQTQTLHQSDRILLVLRLDFTSLRNTRRSLDHLEQLGISRERVRVVVNRYGQPEELPASKVEQALGVKVFHYVPDDPKSINRANNNGTPAVIETASSKFSKSLAQLAASVNGKPKAR